MEQPAAPKRSFFAKIFLSPTERRLRAGWRLLLQTVIMLVIAAAGGVALNLILPQSLAPYANLINQLLELVFITGSILIVRRFLDHRSFASLGLRPDRKLLPDLLVGIFIPFVLMGVIYIVELALDWLTFDHFAWQAMPAADVFNGLLMMTGVYILVGWSEELLSRGYHLQTIASGSNLFWGVLISSSIFGLMHLANPNSENKLMVALGILGAGLFLAYGYLRTGQLWLGIGLHIGWNLFEGPIFGFPVSGTDSPVYLLNASFHGPQLVTGGSFGPEAGLIVFPALLLGTGLIYLYTRGRQPVKKVE
jgi:uncharacterized protein